jgi:hypothetical protein
MMNNVIHLDEYKLKKDLAEVRKLIKKARHMASVGAELPPTAIEDLEAWENQLEERMKQLFLED